MILETFIKVFLLTFSMLFAIGPICLTVINTTVVYGFRSGLAAALGVSTADTVYIFFATFLLSFATKLINSSATKILALFSSFLLVVIAYKFWFLNANKIKSIKINSKSKIKIFASLFTLTITGPTTIITYAIVFSNFTNQAFHVPSLLSGATLATFSFYIILVSFLSLIRKKMTPEIISVLNKISSIVILLFVFLILKNILPDIIKM